nr:MAG: hypothetical protein DIU58_14770 [Sphaerobacter thermophilus]
MSDRPETPQDAKAQVRQITVRVPAEVADEMREIADTLKKSQNEVWATAAAHFLNAVKNPAPRPAPSPVSKPPSRGLKPVLRWRG